MGRYVFGDWILGRFLGMDISQYLYIMMRLAATITALNATLHSLMRERQYSDKRFF